MKKATRFVWIIAASLFLATGIAPAYSAEIAVQMKNTDGTGVTVFVPAYVQANVGDTIHFVATDKVHNAQPIAGMLPQDVDAPPGVMSQDYFLKLSKPGLYGIKCSPHFSMGMVALIKAGKGLPRTPPLPPPCQAWPSCAWRRCWPRPNDRLTGPARRPA